MGVALVEMIDDSFKTPTQVISNVTKLNNTQLKINETHINTTESTIFEQYYNETDIEFNKVGENNTVTNVTEDKEFKDNGFLKTLLLAPPVSTFSIASLNN